MDYNISELKNSTQNFVNKAGTGVTSSDLTSSPASDELSSILSDAIPSKTLKYNSQGVANIGSISNLENTIRTAVNRATNYITNAAKDALNSIVGGGKLVFGGSDTDYKNLSQLETTLKSQAQSYSTTNNQQATSIFNELENSLDTSNITNSMYSPIDDIKNYSPKKTRDLKYPEKYNESLNNVVFNSLNNGNSESTKMSLNAASYNPVSNSGQSVLTQYSSPLASGNVQGGIRMKVRRTVYWAQGPGSDIDTAMYKSATGRILKEGVSAAVDNDPKNGGIAFLSRVVFDDIGERFAVDWGSDVAKRTASKGQLPIVDIFFERKEDADRFANTQEKEVFVTVYPPKTKYTYALNSPPTFGRQA